MTIRIGIAEDYKVFREALMAILEADEDIRITMEAENGAEMLDALKKEQPDIILMDLKMPVMGGIEATRIIRQQYPQVKVLVISMYSDDTFISHLVKGGANGYLLKNTEPEQIREAIHALMENGYYFHEPIDNQLLRELILKNNLMPTFNQDIALSETEKKILASLGHNPQDESITRETRLELMQKIGVPNTAGLVMYALVKGLTGELPAS